MGSIWSPYVIPDETSGLHPLKAYASLLTDRKCGLIVHHLSKLIIMQWYYAKGNSQFGPIPANELHDRILSGELAQSDRVWREGMTDWLPVSQVAELPKTSPISAPPPSPAPPPQQVYIQPHQYAPSYLWQSIVVTVLCCLPFGIPAIVYASRVESLNARGEVQQARIASEKAKFWCWASALTWVALAVIYLGFVMLIAVSAPSSL